MNSPASHTQQPFKHRQYQHQQQLQLDEQQKYEQQRQHEMQQKRLRQPTGEKLVEFSHNFINRHMLHHHNSYNVLTEKSYEKKHTEWTHKT